MVDADSASAEIADRNYDEKPLLLEVDGRLYDVAKFAKRHPGGEKVMRRAAGEKADGYMRGEQRLMGVKHEHSEAAYRILSKYAVDGKGGDEDMVDIKKPVLRQVGHLHDRYWTWIHQPLDSNLRLFQSDLLETFTNTKWFVVPLVWMPLVIGMGLLGLKSFCDIYGLVYGGGIWGMLFGLGSVAWSLLEYSLHRGVFHWQPDPKSRVQITAHFLIHGIHHKTPMDGLRLVFPPLPAIPIVAFFYFLYKALLPWPVFCAFGAGKLFGYVCYDVIHYHLHHGHPAPNSNYHYRKVYHHNHHYKDGDSELYDNRLDEVLINAMYLKYYLDDEGKRVYTLKKVDSEGKPTQSAHPARFSPEDKYSSYRVIIKRRFGLLPTMQPKPTY